jgi:hypothetical protein
MLNAAHTNLALLVLASTFGIGCANGAGSGDENDVRKQGSERVDLAGAQLQLPDVQADAPVVQPGFANALRMADMVSAFSDSLGPFLNRENATSLPEMILASKTDDTRFYQASTQHAALNYVARNGQLAIAPYEPWLSRRSGTPGTASLPSDTQALFATIATLSEKDEVGSLAYLLSAHSPSERSSAVQALMIGIGNAGLEQGLADVHARLAGGFLKQFAHLSALGLQTGQPELAMQVLRWRFASLAAEQIRGARLLAAYYTFQGRGEPVASAESAAKVRALQTVMNARLQEQAAIFLQGAAEIQIVHGNSPANVVRGESGELSVADALSSELGVSAAVSHIVRDAAVMGAKGNTTLHVAFIARSVDRDVEVRLSGSLLHHEGVRSCSSWGVGSCEKWTWSKPASSYAIGELLKGSSVSLPETVGGYGYLHQERDGVHLSTSNQYTLFESEVILPVGEENRAFDELSLSYASGAALVMRPEADGVFAAASDFRYRGASSHVAAFNWSSETSGAGEFLSPESIYAGASVKAQVQDYASKAGGSTGSSQTLSMPLIVDRDLSGVMAFGSWQVARRVVGGTGASSSIRVDCESSGLAAQSAVTKRSIYLGHALLADDSSSMIGNPGICQDPSVLRVASMGDSPVREFQGVSSANTGVFVKSGALSAGKTELRIDAGVSSSDPNQLFYSASEISLQSFIVTLPSKF